MRHLTLVSIIVLLFTYICSGEDTQTQQPRLDITLRKVRGTTIKAVIKNTSRLGIYLLRQNLFDAGAKETKKVSVYRNGTLIPFAGISFNYDMGDITCDDFIYLPPESTLSDEFDIATTTDLSVGGSIKIHSQGIISYSTESCNAVTGAMRYKSNDLTFVVDGEAASAIFNNNDIISTTTHLSKRTEVQDDCRTPQYHTATLRALGNANRLGTLAADAASSNCDARFQEYFKTCNPSIRQTVANNFYLAANEASSTVSGKTIYFCTDELGHCAARPERKILAYYHTRTGTICLCERYWMKEDVSRVCHEKDRWSISLHELLHGVNKHVIDIDGAYGYREAMQLSKYEAFRNADNYALYVNALYLDCPVNQTNPPEIVG